MSDIKKFSITNTLDGDTEISFTVGGRINMDDAEDIVAVATKIEALKRLKGWVRNLLEIFKSEEKALCNRWIEELNELEEALHDMEGE